MVFVIHCAGGSALACVVMLVRLVVNMLMSPVLLFLANMFVPTIIMLCGLQVL